MPAGGRPVVFGRHVRSQIPLMRCAKMVWVIFRRFLSFGPFFWTILGTAVKNAKHKKVVPGNSLNFQIKIKNPSIHIWVPNMCFVKMYIFGASIELEGPGMVSS